MINIKSEIVKALESNQELISLLGGKRIYQLKAPNSEEFPRVTYFELNNFDNDYADDTAISSDISYQFSIWTKNAAQLAPIGMQIDLTMKSLNFKRTSSIDMYEDDVGVFHRAMRFYTIREV